jgi:peptidoglycan/xylan/chitin deacetylase (PgdA/CDA1 family)
MTGFPPLASPRYRVALTFDDGPRPATDALRQTLDRYGVRSTFFVVGHMARRYPELVRALAAEGHEIASHTWSHRDIRRLPQQELKMELDMTRTLIKTLTGHDQYLFRAPGGQEAFLQRRFVYPANYTLVGWDVHSLDQEGLSAEAISRRMAAVEDGDIVLMHNGMKTTMEALDKIIPALRARGFEFVTVSELAGS